MLRSITYCAGILALTVATVHADKGNRGDQGAVFISSNEAEHNRVLAFARDTDGTLAEPQAFATEGRGSGDSLGSQGALALSEDGRFLLVVNAGSADVSVFAVQGASLELRARVASGGERPVSISERCGLVFVLNAGGAANVTGFTLDRRGQLQAITGGAAALSGSDLGAAQVELSPDARLLVVTEKSANRLESFRVGAYGQLRGPELTSSAGMTPYGFDISRRGYVIVSEAAGSASSYDSDRHANLEAISAAVSDTQAAPCWLTISRDDRYAFVANAGSESLSSYAISSHGELSLQAARAGEVGAGSHPLDLATTPRGSYLYALDRGRGVVGFMIESDGALDRLGDQGGATEFASGVAAY